MFTAVELLPSYSQRAEVSPGHPSLSWAGSCCCNIHLLGAVCHIPLLPLPSGAS